MGGYSGHVNGAEEDHAGWDCVQGLGDWRETFTARRCGFRARGCVLPLALTASQNSETLQSFSLEKVDGCTASSGTAGTCAASRELNIESMSMRISPCGSNWNQLHCYLPNNIAQPAA